MLGVSKPHLTGYFALQFTVSLNKELYKSGFTMTTSLWDRYQLAGKHNHRNLLYI